MPGCIVRNRLDSGLTMQLALVAQARGKYRLVVLEVTTGDITAPSFAQPPLISSDETALSMRVSVSEPATLHWAITYEDVSAEYRYQLLGFKTSLLSAEQVLAVSDQAEPGIVLPWPIGNGLGCNNTPKLLKQDLTLHGMCPLSTLIFFAHDHMQYTRRVYIRSTLLGCTELIICRLSFV